MAYPRPGYRAIFEELRNAISAGTYAPDEMLPSQNVLKERYGVSQTTVARAIHDLELLGFVRVERGVGAFVLAADQRPS